MLHTIKIQYDNSGDLTQMDWDMLVEENVLVPFYKRHLDTDDIIDFLTDILGKTEFEVIKLFLEETTEGDTPHNLIKDMFKEENVDYDDETIDEYSLEIISEFKSMFVLNDTTVDKILDRVGFACGTVGYSEWSTIIYKKSLDFNWINSMYEGHDYYDLSYSNDEGEEEYISLGYIHYGLDSIDYLLDQITDIVEIKKGDTFEIEQEVFGGKTEDLLLEKLIEYSNSQPMRVVEEPIFEVEEVRYQINNSIRSLTEKIKHWEDLQETDNANTLTKAKELLQQLGKLLD